MSLQGLLALLLSLGSMVAITGEGRAHDIPEDEIPPPVYKPYEQPGQAALKINRRRDSIIAQFVIPQWNIVGSDSRELGVIQAAMVEQSKEKIAGFHEIVALDDGYDCRLGYQKVSIHNKKRSTRKDLDKLPFAEREKYIETFVEVSATFKITCENTPEDFVLETKIFRLAPRLEKLFVDTSMSDETIILTKDGKLEI